MPPELHAHDTYLTLTSQTTVKGIKVGTLGSYWKDADRDKFPEDEEVVGTLARWTNVNDGRLRIDWPDGFDIEDLTALLVPRYNFRLIATATGGVVKRKGVGHPAPGLETGSSSPRSTPTATSCTAWGTAVGGLSITLSLRVAPPTVARTRRTRRTCSPPRA